MRFIGDYPGKTDAKGRVFLPASFRKQLEMSGERRLILRPDVFERCLVLYPETLWNELLDEMRARLNRWNGDHQRMIRQFVAEAEVVELDSNGRFLINKRKQQYAGIAQDVRFLAVDDHIEVWDKQQLERKLDEQDELGANLQSVLGSMPAMPPQA
jgi:MraZ protein